MTDRRLPLLALLVAGLVAIVALVAHGRPLAASAGHGGVPSPFWSYVLTTVTILFALGVLVALASLLSVRMTFTKPNTSFVALFLRNFLWMVLPLLILAYLFSRFHHGPIHVKIPGGGAVGKGPTGHTSGAHFVWLEAVIVFGLIAVSIAAAVAIGRRKRVSPGDSAISPEAVAEALDESLDDLRTDPDVPRAIVAAYARMENALRVTGLPRQPAEAPLEYLERALLTLDTSGPSVRRLTDLFEWAKFSHHEPEPTMRDEAIDALIAVRDELRAPVEVPA
jgi:Domain of unknown function (DUF4129)